MYDKEFSLEILRRLDSSIETIIKRFEPIISPENFTCSDAGLEKLDAICMQLIAIGEGLKNLDKVTNNSLLPNYPEIEWKKIKGMRDIITHHYFDLNAEAIYEVCQNHIEQLRHTIKKIISEL
ncbi:MAG: DUF86 domain-containing protein [Deltaproteobacteria bacterium]|nr:DUF86 domain-containing protein [Deltaproteobacteria bacterium]